MSSQPNKSISSNWANSGSDGFWYFDCQGIGQLDELISGRTFLPSVAYPPVASLSRRTPNRLDCVVVFLNR